MPQPRPNAIPAAAVLAALALAVARRSPAPLVAATAAWLLARWTRPGAEPAESEWRRRAEALAASRTAELEHQAQTASRLRHDVRGALSPALLMADRLSMAEDPDKKRSGELIARAVGRAVELLRPPPPQP